jgi:hypothetical protein
MASDPPEVCDAAWVVGVRASVKRASLVRARAASAAVSPVTWLSAMVTTSVPPEVCDAA